MCPATYNILCLVFSSFSSKHSHQRISFTPMDFLQCVASHLDTRMQFLNGNDIYFNSSEGLGTSVCYSDYHFRIILVMEQVTCFYFTICLVWRWFFFFYESYLKEFFKVSWFEPKRRVFWPSTKGKEYSSLEPVGTEHGRRVRIQVHELSRCRTWY